MIRTLASSRIQFVPEVKRAQTYGSFRRPLTTSLTQAKARQWIKMREVEAALRRVGLVDLDEQAKALGISRTATWRLLRSDYNGSGPSAAIINRVLRAQRLPLPVRIKILEYIQERPECMGTANLNRVAFRSGSDGGRARTHIDGPMRHWSLNFTPSPRGSFTS